MIFFVHRPRQLKAIERGFENAISSGPLLGYPVLGADFELLNATIKNNTSDAIISTAMVQGIRKLLSEANAVLMEPMMSLVINSDPEVVPTLTNDILLQRRGQVLDRQDLKSMVVLTAQIPLSELKGYSTHLRVITSGKAFFGMEFSHYEPMDLINQNKAIFNVTGFSPS